MLHLTLQNTFSSRDQVVIYPVYTQKKHCITGDMPQKLKKIADQLIREKEFKADHSEIKKIENYPGLSKHIILIGLGELEKMKRWTVRDAFAVATKEARNIKKKTATFVLTQELEKFADVIAEAVGLSNYILGKFKTGKEDQEGKKKQLETVHIATSSKEKSKIEEMVRRGLLIAESVNSTRDLVNQPSNVLTPKAMADDAVKIAKENGYKIKVFEKKELEKLGMGGIIGVNSAAHQNDEQAARMVMMEYMPVKDQRPIVLIGKGIIFDSGGYNLKPSRSMENMHEDMAGGAAVFGVFRLLKKLKIQQNVIGIIPITENLVSDTSYKPTDIITTYSGKTVEITNTDAEGRMVLCDALSYAEKNLNPRQMIDIATLTGACVVALGDRYAGLMGTNRKIMKALRKAGNYTDELIWELPMHRDHYERLKSKIADIQNACKEYGADSQKGAMFLQQFIGKVPWAHIDIAGVAFVDMPKKYDFPQGTGFGVRLLTTYLKRLE